MTALAVLAVLPLALLVGAFLWWVARAFVSDRAFALTMLAVWVTIPTAVWGIAYLSGGTS